MKPLIVYATKNGTTKKAAEILAERLGGADVKISRAIPSRLPTMTVFWSAVISVWGRHRVQLPSA